MKQGYQLGKRFFAISQTTATALPFVVRPLSRREYPVLARIWDNDADAIYDLPPHAP